MTDRAERLRIQAARLVLENATLSLGGGVQMDTDAQRALEVELEEAANELDRLRELDAEYGRVEAAIIMADPAFDGDSDHATCGDRLIASVNRLRAENERLRAALQDHTHD